MLKKIYRMKKKANFQSVFAHGKSYTSRQVVIYIFKGQTKRFGFIASKKVGNAVKRNRAKRMMREIVRLNMECINCDCQMIYVARAAINKATYAEVEKSIRYIWRKAGILDEKKP